MREPVPRDGISDEVRFRDQLWASLRTDGFRPDVALDTLALIVAQDIWRDLGFTDFADFIYGRPPDGIGLTPERLELLFAHPEASDGDKRVAMVAEVRRLLDQPLAEPGGDRSGGGEEQDNNVILPSRQGNDPGYTRRRLRRDRPDLYERVVEGELSANAAAIEAGFRRRTATIPVDSVESAVGALLRRFTAAEIVAAAKAKAGVDG